jgi:hypothetical protein
MRIQSLSITKPSNFSGAYNTAELFAILDKNGVVVRKGIKAVIDFVKDRVLFIVRLKDGGSSKNNCILVWRMTIGKWLFLRVTEAS